MNESTDKVSNVSEPTAPTSTETTATPLAADAVIVTEASAQQATPSESETASAGPDGAVDTGRRIDPTLLTSPKRKKRTMHRKQKPGQEAKSGGATDSKDQSKSNDQAKSKEQPKEAKKGGKRHRPHQKNAKKKRPYVDPREAAKKELAHLPETPVDYTVPDDNVTFAELFQSQSIENVSLSRGDKVDATLIHVGKDSAFFTLNQTQEATMPLGELIDDKGNLNIAPGDTISAYISNTRSGIELSKRLAGNGFDLQLIEDAKASQIPVQGKVTGHNKGGIEVTLMGTRAFCPMGQVALGYVEDVTSFVGQTLDFIITEVKESGKNVVVSRRKILEGERAEAREKTLKTLEPGLIKEGVIVRVQPFGAFVDLGGVDALIPISEMSHARIETPDEVLSVGDRVSVEVLQIGDDPKRPGQTRISCSLKRTLKSPFDEYAEELVVGADVAGVVTQVKSFGAFVSLFGKSSGIEGMCHISELSDERVRLVQDVVEVGQEVTVKIIEINRDTDRIALSLKDAGRVRQTPENAAENVQKMGLVRGAEVHGKIDRIERYGVFLRFENGGSGLLPASESSAPRGTEMRRHFTVGQELDALIIDIDEKSRIRLSEKALVVKREREEIDDYKKTESKSSIGSLGDLLKNVKL